MPLCFQVTDKSKEERTSIHTAIKKKYNSKLISNTKEADDKKFIDVFMKKNKKEGMFIYVNKYNLTFVLFKRNTI